MSSLESVELGPVVQYVRTALLHAATPAGPWEGRLSESALSTATAAVALTLMRRAEHGGSDALPDPQAASGLAWLRRNQNPDGGWGDTTISHSNPSTTVLVWAALGLASEISPKSDECLRRAESWITRHAGGIAPETVARAIIARYGKDRTFSVPILTHCALAGRLGDGSEAWRHVLPLPFELAALPRSWFAALRLPVVSYALPALIAMGLARHVHKPSGNPVARGIRGAVRERTLRVLDTIQPENGGFLEATPLTSFITMSLAGSGLAGHPVAQRGLGFLRASQRPDGSWPIDTNLATWVTTLAINALHSGGPARREAWKGPVREWLLAQQHAREHPYTGAAPGGWAWTDLPGGVPDADDTAGALLALRRLPPMDDRMRQAGEAGAGWLLGLQNRDGGVPTFCRGWGTLPFDRSSADITAHALRAWQAWKGDLSPALQTRVDAAIDRALAFLCRIQAADGSWNPLWFGNQHVADEVNPTYGTSRVVAALAGCPQTSHSSALSAACARGVEWLLAAQNAEGAWGGAPGCPPSVEESALAVEALSRVLCAPGRDLKADAWSVRQAVERGAAWLIARVREGSWTTPSPIGFYFAKLWYHEALYPTIYTVAALTRAQRALQHAS